MSVATERDDLKIIIGNICRYLLVMVSAEGSQAAELRRQIGLIQSFGLNYLEDETFGTKLWNCFVIARTLAVTTDMVALLREQISLEQPKEMIATLVVESAIIFCLTTECLFITNMEFKSSDDAQAMMRRMKTAFDKARDQAAERMDSASYQNLTYLAGSITNHLNMTALRLPRLVQFQYQTNWPALTMAHLIYQDATRSEELMSENKVVHPAFMPLVITGLSS